MRTLFSWKSTFICKRETCLGFLIQYFHLYFRGPGCTWMKYRQNFVNLLARMWGTEYLGEEERMCLEGKNVLAIFTVLYFYTITMEYTYSWPWEKERNLFIDFILHCWQNYFIQKEARQKITMSYVKYGYIFYTILWKETYNNITKNVEIY